MSETYLPREAPVAIPVAAPKIGVAVSFAVLILLASLGLISIRSVAPPAAVNASAPPEVFSSARALEHVKVIAGEPRPLGSKAHVAARDYLVHQIAAAGLTPELQKTSAMYQSRFGPITGGSVENVLVRVPGQQNTKAVLLVAHYDSVATANGASDNGAAVGALLEALRAVKSAPPLKNDLILLFSDGEEAGLLGARAFVEEHPWAGSVGVVLNFEARGTSGPSFLFETSNGNRRLVEEFARVSPYPAGNSMANDLYAMIKNDTDMSIFKNAGYAGLNFAYADGYTRYHTPIDDVEHLDERSLQHHGSHLVSLTRHFGNMDLRIPKTENSVYFDLFGSVLIHYSRRWVLPLLALNAAIYIGLFVFGLRRGRLKFSGVGFGFLALLLAMLCSALAVTAAWRLFSPWLNGEGNAPFGGAYYGDLLLLGFAALAVAITFGFYLLFGTRANLANLMGGSLLCWLLLLLLSSLSLPGASYLFTWPLLCGLLAWGYVLTRDSRETVDGKTQAVLAVCALPGIILLPAAIYQLGVFLTPNVLAPSAVLAVLLFSLPAIHFRRAGRWLVPTVAALSIVCLVAAARFHSTASAETPRQNELFYWLDGDTQKASWATFDRKPDTWTSQFLTTSPAYRTLDDLMPGAPPLAAPRAQAPNIETKLPAITLLNDSSEGGVRTLNLRVSSGRGAANVAVYITSDAEVIGTQVEGKALKGSAPTTAGPKQRWTLYYKNLPPEGIALALDVKATEPVKLKVVDQSFGLPRFPGVHYNPRPASFIPSADPLNDSTLVSKSFIF